LRPNWNTQKIKSALNEKSGGTFLWVALILKVLMLLGKTFTMKQVQKRLEETPTDLRDIYDRIMGEIDEEHVEDAWKLLQCVIAASRPLHVAELTEAHAFMMPNWPKTQAELREAAEDLADNHKFCGSLLFVDAQDNTVNLIHQSAKDYLLSSYLQQHQKLADYHVVQENANLLLFESCWRCLSLSELDNLDNFDISFDMSSVDNPFDILPTREYDPGHSWGPEFDSIKFLSYAAGQWIFHALAATREIEKSYIWKGSYLGNRPLLRDRWLCRVSADGHEVVAQLLLDRGAQVNAKNDSNLTALYRAVSWGHIGIVKLLLDYKANVNANNGFGATALHQAASCGEIRVVQLLLDYKANVHAKNIEDATELHQAASRGHIRVVKLLLDYKANVNTEDWPGRTALLCAASTGHELVVQLLLDKGADPNAAEKSGMTALMYASQGHLAMLQLLLDKGAKVQTTDYDNLNALHWAARYGDEKIVKRLLTRGAVLGAPNFYGTALSCATDRGHDAVVKLLLAHNANLEERGLGDYWETPLFLAAAGGCDSIVLQLLEKGANMDARGLSGQTALEGARAGGHNSTARLLERWSKRRSKHQSKRQKV
jgi:ankyrin repeat protein